MYHTTKRLLDILLSAVALLLLSPLLIPLLIALRLTGEGEVFYLQPRVGLGGREFRLFKFVTMLKNSEQMGSGTITLKNDTRVLPLGRFLRATKINELPQLLNVLRGELSIVGPRPQTQECFDFFPEPYQADLLKMKPGITSLGSIVFRDEEALIGASSKSYDACYGEDIMPHKARLELWYKKRRSIALDCWLIFLTAWVVVFPRSTWYMRHFKDLPVNTGTAHEDSH